VYIGFLQAKPFCKLCNVKYLKFSELEEHQSQMHGLDNFEIEEHEETESYAVYRCHVCKDDFPNRSALRAHCKDEHNIKVRTK